MLTNNYSNQIQLLFLGSLHVRLWKQVCTQVCVSPDFCRQFEVEKRLVMAQKAARQDWVYSKQPFIFLLLLLSSLRRGSKFGC